MSKQTLRTIGREQLKKIIDQLKSNLSILGSHGKDQRVVDAVNTTEATLLKKAQSFIVPPQPRLDAQGRIHHEALNISHTLAFLRLAEQQRADPATKEDLAEIDRLIQSCYQPVKNVLTDDNRFNVSPGSILSVYFQDEYLARPSGPVPYLLVPNFYEGNKPDEWMGVGHETGHHIYRQAIGLREEIEVTIAKVLSISQVTVNGVSGLVPDRQRRLWFNALEETFADLWGILTLGAPFLYSQQAITIYAGSRDSSKPIRDPAQPVNPEHEYLQGLREGQDTTHPIPLLQLEMGIHIYEQLLNSSSSSNPYLAPLKQGLADLKQNMNSLTLTDPHTPKTPSLSDNWNPTGKLDYDETVAVMKLLVDPLLNEKFCSLDNQSIASLVDFVEDEGRRKEAVNNPETEEESRIVVAAKRLRLLNKTA